MVVFVSPAAEVPAAWAARSQDCAESSCETMSHRVQHGSPRCHAAASVCPQTPACTLCTCTVYYYYYYYDYVCLQCFDVVPEKGPLNGCVCGLLPLNMGVHVASWWLRASQLLKLGGHTDINIQSHTTTSCQIKYTHTPRLTALFPGLPG